MRLFTGLDVAANVAENLQSVLDRLKPTAPLKWTPPHNFHLTTKFIGEWPEERLPLLMDTLKSLETREPIDIRVAGIGWFPNPHNPRVLWTGVKAGPELETLATDTDAALARIGVASETKKFSPHFTLARIKEPVQLSSVRQAIAQLPALDFGSFTCDRFFLYLSKPGPSGSIYTKLAEFPLNSAQISE